MGMKECLKGTAKEAKQLGHKGGATEPHARQSSSKEEEDKNKRQTSKTAGAGHGQGSASQSKEKAQEAGHKGGMHSC
jgi:hypothetical protein